MHKLFFGQPKVRLSGIIGSSISGLLLMGALSFTSLLGLFGCKNQAKNSGHPILIVSYPVSLREQADEKSAEIEQLESGDELADLNRTSRFLASIYLDGRLRQEPWLWVETSSGRQGWVFAGAVLPEGTNTDQQLNWVLEKRFQALFGLQLSQRWKAWTSRKDLITTDSAFAQVLREGMALQDTLNQLMATLATRDPGQTPPDMYWLGDSSPYFIIQQIPNQNSYSLFLDYKAVGKQATQTSGEEDDRFAQIGFLTFPLDSIGSTLPAWVFPLSLEESCSNLGAGMHFNILRAIDQTLQKGKLFAPELMALKNWILDDILDKDRSYWQPQEKILTELGQIRKAKLTCLTARDQLALEARQAMFESPEKNNLHLNRRTGE
ncbi:MAG: hypothetical protein H6574_05895 [Lewinellaceae bacterium]|nr:hypothetical protein [Lewinellaceae bacterium]MCB9330593.1 hypothetical protein [Lewinellaceae bacterium]